MSRHKNRMHNGHANSAPSNINNDSVSIGTAEDNSIQGRNNIEDIFVPPASEIERRAYQIYEQKGGSALDNWFEAERLLKEENARR